jgi:hypothetical protein
VKKQSSDVENGAQTQKEAKTGQAKKDQNRMSALNTSKNGGKGNEDIMKELEDYVLEKKQANKYLDDISDIETTSTNAHIKKQERKSKK